jgi:hypothetical protein
MADGDGQQDGRGEACERQRGERRRRRAARAAAGQVGLDRAQIPREDGAMDAVEPRLELVDAQAAGGGVGGEPVGGRRALAIADAHGVPIAAAGRAG